MFRNQELYLIDLYARLDVFSSASAEDIRKSYKKLALKHHPDKNPNDKKQAEINFKKIQEAYVILSDSDRRRDYDRNRVCSVPSFTADFTYSAPQRQDKTEVDIAKENVIYLKNLLSHALMTGGKHLGLSFVVSLLFSPLFKIYALSAKNPILAEKIFRIIMETVETYSEKNPGYRYMPSDESVEFVERKWSPICSKMLQGFISIDFASHPLAMCHPIFSKTVNLISKANPNYTLTTAEIFEHHPLARASMAAGMASFSLVFATKETYRICEQGKPIWSNSLSNTEKSRRILLLIIMLSFAYLALEMMTGATHLAESWELVPATCARACNAANYIMHRVNGTDHVYTPNLTEEVMPAVSMTETVLAKVGSIAIAPVSMAVSGLFGCYHRKTKLKTDDFKFDEEQPYRPFQ